MGASHGDLRRSAEATRCKTERLTQPDEQLIEDAKYAAWLRKEGLGEVQITTILASR